MAIKFEVAVRMLAFLRANSPVELEHVAKIFNLKSSEVRKYCLLLNEARIGEYYGEFVEVEIQDDEDGIWIETRESQGLTEQIRFTVQESIAILGGLKYLQAMPHLVDREIVSALLAKLQTAFDAPEDVIQIGTAEIDMQIVDSLKSAIAEGRCVETTYGAGIDQKVTERTIEPILLFADETVLYVRAYCRLAQDWRTFRVDRILSARYSTEVTSKTEEQGPRFEISAPTLTAQLRMLPEMLESFAPETVTNVSPDQDRLIVQVQVNSSAWLASLVLASGGDIEVLGPDELRIDIIGKAEKWFAHNGD